EDPEERQLSHVRLGYGLEDERGQRPVVASGERRAATRAIAIGSVAEGPVGASPVPVRSLARRRAAHQPVAPRPTEQPFRTRLRGTRTELHELLEQRTDAVGPRGGPAE